MFESYVLTSQGYVFISHAVCFHVAVVYEGWFRLMCKGWFMLMCGGWFMLLWCMRADLR